RRTIIRGVIVLAAIPSIVLLVPRYVMVDAWGWSDEFTGLAAPALVSAGAVLFLYQVFRALPRGPEEAARLDGAGHWRVFSRVVVPQARPALAVVAGFAILAQWRGLLWPLVVSHRAGPEVAEQGLARRLVEGASGLSVPELLAVGVTIAVPAMAIAACVALARARTATAARRTALTGGSLERHVPAEVSPLTPGPFEHQILSIEHPHRSGPVPRERIRRPPPRRDRDTVGATVELHRPPTQGLRFAIPVFVLKIDTPLRHVAGGPDDQRVIGARAQSKDQAVVGLEGDVQRIGGREGRVVPHVVPRVCRRREAKVGEADRAVDVLVGPVGQHHRGPLPRPRHPDRRAVQ